MIDSLQISKRVSDAIVGLYKSLH